MDDDVKDLVVLAAADKQMEYALKGIISRHQSIGIRQLDVEYYRHPHSDPGCRNEAEKFLRPFHQDFAHALIVFDYHGSGQPDLPAEDLEVDIEERMRRSGWETRARCVVIEPELEVWVWSDSPEVDRCLEWERQTSLRQWLEEKGYWEANAEKPRQPKEALEQVLHEVRLPRSSSRFQKLAESVSLRRCNDRAFLKLRRTLREWFPREN